MSCKGLDINSGALDSNEAEAEIKKTMIRQATEVALLVDHSKFDRKAFVQLADFSHINYIITDKSPGAEWIAFAKTIISSWCGNLSTHCQYYLFLRPK